MVHDSLSSFGTVAAMTDRPEFLSATPAFAVSDIQRSVAFYAEVLALEPVVAESGFALLRRDRVALSLWHADGSAPGAERELAGTVSCAIEVSAIDALHDQCLGFGCVHPNAPIHDTEWSTREFAILDPDNNLVTFWQAVGSRAEPR
jgi:catechol 2,3-dioxygenase-like lactoylglutathione lyase family enzyme